MGTSLEGTGSMRNGGETKRDRGKSVARMSHARLVHVSNVLARSVFYVFCDWLSSLEIGSTILNLVLPLILQVLRSVGFWSAGTSQPEETSIHIAYCSLIDKSEYFVYIEVTQNFEWGWFGHLS